MPDPSPLTLRPVTEEELPILAGFLGEIDDQPPMPLERARAVLARIAQHPDYTVYLAEHEGGIVGTISMIVFPVFSRGGSSEAIVEAVVIGAAHRGKGLGRLMIEETMRMARDKGCYKLALSSNLRRLDAHRFYDGMSFVRHGVSFSTEV
ncbi:GNAT family N-acetyltransferase [Uliginosibacterium sp. H1]|uniref:GNAT family N-acetyltransferase n=1 Tax=Uliginosibacterium sp. H1 TaxID=3114757 RepID=UPI002E190D1F|nr:GNAT family N-acetyltransferase [Uliginosibacterium sp. H1]